ncbi:hypothetical protein OH492_16815 [Vibrio chagasii]|nr:hypothetical protein [Vibrio chagasii]
MENLEGGLDYLKEVVIEDNSMSLLEPEADIAPTSSNHQCEWKTTIESPAKMKRLQHYINSEEMDSSSLSFIKEREQRFPKPSASRTISAD